MRKLIVVPAVITLAVTLLRLVGELNNWDPKLFNRAAGGGGALVGIVWLVPIFGAYFGWKLARAGSGPQSAGRAALSALAGLVLAAAVIFVGARFVPNRLVQFVVFNLAMATGGFVASRGWPRLGSTVFAYGLAARIPVAVIMLIAILGNWGTHYDVAPPDLSAMGAFAKWVLIGLIPQLVLWMGFTMIVGCLAGALAALATRPARAA